MSQPHEVASQGFTQDSHAFQGVLERSTDTRHIGPKDYQVGSRRGGVKVERFVVEAQATPPVLVQGRETAAPFGRLVSSETVAMAGDRTYEVIPEPAAREQPRPPASTLIPSERTVPTEQTFPIAAVPRPKVKVILKGTGLGRQTLFCSGVFVSESLVVVRFTNDGEMTIVEPPACGPEDPLLVTYADKTYRCLAGEWGVEIDGQYLVVLVRLPDTAA